jgi:uncharacterized protein YndB with AHSA1/START domain
MHEFTLTREIAAPRDTVFAAWTDPAHLAWLFNPEFETDEPITVDLSVGGEWRQRMIIDESYNYVTGGVYREIVPGERLVFAWGAVDGWPEIDLDNLDATPTATVSLADSSSADSSSSESSSAATTMTLDLLVPDEAWHPAMQAGWSDTIDRLVAALAPRH